MHVVIRNNLFKLEMSCQLDNKPNLMNFERTLLDLPHSMHYFKVNNYHDMSNLQNNMCS